MSSHSAFVSPLPLSSVRFCSSAAQTSFLRGSSTTFNTFSTGPPRSTIVCQANVSTTSLSESYALPRRVSRAIVWLRPGDLRTEDHAGLDAACLHTADALAPLLVLTPYSPPTLLAAARRLRKQLEKKRSCLVIRWDLDEANGVAKFAEQFGAERIHVRMDVEEEARRVVAKVEKLVDGFASVWGWKLELREWEEQLNEVRGEEAWLSDMPDIYPEYLKWEERNRAPIIESDTSFSPDVILPGLGYIEGGMGDLDHIQDIAHLHGALTPSPQRSKFDLRVKEDDQYVRKFDSDIEDPGFAEQVILEYLKRSDNYLCPDLGRSLGEVFQQGALSPRRIWELVVSHERANGRIWRFVYRDGAKLMLDYMQAREFANLMARRDVALERTVDGEHRAKFWRWKGYLTRYVEGGIPNQGNDNRPPLLLIHGFGASSQHWKRSIRVLKKNYHVFALDMIGFGRAEKPPMQYTQELWELFIWDFIKEVIQTPVYIAGNSIGGYFSAAFAADSFGDLCKGVCLVNTSGRLDDNGSTSLQTTKAEKIGLFKYVLKEWRAARLFVGNVLLNNLRGRVEKTLKFVYPVNPETADEQLANNIMRDSFDYGAGDVLASGLVLPPTRSLTELLKMYDGPMLIFQGDLDPLNNAADRGDKIKAQYAKARLVHVQAGHCPHEEVSESFVQAISEWMDENNETRSVVDSESTRAESIA